MADAVRPPAVEVRFVKSTQAAITLDFILPDEKRYSGPAVERYELQWREAEWGAADGMVEESSWTTASSALKLGRCTKVRRREPPPR